jgi:threonine aldolase
VLAAAGLVALEETPPRLAEDHENARLLAEGLGNLRGVRVSPPATNIVIFDIRETGMAAAELSARLREAGVLINPVGPTALRAVTHYDVSRADCEKALEAVASVLTRQ